MRAWLSNHCCEGNPRKETHVHIKKQDSRERCPQSVFFHFHLVFLPRESCITTHVPNKSVRATFQDKTTVCVDETLAAYLSLNKFLVTAGSWSIIMNCVARDGARWLEIPFTILAHRDSPEAVRLSTPETEVGLVMMVITNCGTSSRKTLASSCHPSPTCWSRLNGLPLTHSG